MPTQSPASNCPLGTASSAALIVSEQYAPSFSENTITAAGKGSITIPFPVSSPNKTNL